MAKTSNTTKSLLTIEQRAEVRKIVHDAMPKRARYNTRAAVASDESYRVKLLALQGGNARCSTSGRAGALDAAGYDSLIFQKKDDKSAIPDFVEVFVFGKKEPRAKVTKRKSVRSRGGKSPVKAVKAKPEKVSKLSEGDRKKVRSIAMHGVRDEGYLGTFSSISANGTYRYKLWGVAVNLKLANKLGAGILVQLNRAGFGATTLKVNPDRHGRHSIILTVGVGPSNREAPPAIIANAEAQTPNAKVDLMGRPKRKTKKVIVDNESLYGTGTGRSHTTNSGLPKGVKASDVKPGTVVEVWWNDAPACKVLVTEVDRPTSKQGRVIGGEIDYRGIDEHGTAGQRFVSTQILEVVAEAEQSLSLLFGRIVGSDEVLAPRLLRVYRDMCDLAGNHADVPVIMKGHRGGRGEVVVGDSSMDEVTAEEYQQMAKLPGIVERFVLIPGCAPAWLLSHKDNVHTFAHEVAIDYRNRPGQPIEL